MFCIHTITASSGKPLLPVARPPHLRHYRVYVPVRTAGYQLRQTCAATVPSDVYSENSHLRSRLCPFRSASCTVSPSLPKAMPTYYENGRITRLPELRLPDQFGKMQFFFCTVSGCQIFQYSFQYGTHGDRLLFY